MLLPAEKIELKPIRRKVDQQLGQLQSAKDSLKRETKSLTSANEQLQHTSDALSSAQTVAAAVQSLAHQKIADVVSRSLSAVFNDPFEFRVVFSEKRGRTEASLVFAQNGHDIDPMTASGGGVVAVASLSLRLSCLMLSEPPVRKLLVLDEPAAHLSKEFVPRLRMLLDSLAKELNVQIIVVSHLEGLGTGTVITI